MVGRLIPRVASDAANFSFADGDGDGDQRGHLIQLGETRAIAVREEGLHEEIGWIHHFDFSIPFPDSWDVLPSDKWRIAFFFAESRAESDRDTLYT